MARRPRVVVVGGGISGLTTAWLLASAADAPAVTLLEASPRLGGKIRTEDLDGMRVEVGADSFLAVTPEAEQLCRRLGLGDELVAPAASAVKVWSRRRLRPLPGGLVLGVPSRLGPLVRSGLLSPAGLVRAGLDLLLPTSREPGDPSVSELVGRRFGRQVVDRLVDPLLAGVYAGSPSALSAAAATPQLAEAARRNRSLLLGLRARPSTGRDRPVFLTVRGGLERMVARLAEGLDVRCSSPVRSITRSSGTWRVMITDSSRPPGDPRSPARGEALTADAVAVAAPAPVAAHLLSELTPTAADNLARIRYASVATIALVYQDRALLSRVLPSGSGVLVPSEEATFVKALTWVSSKWPHVASGDRVVVRASVGRLGDDTALRRGDEDMVASVREDLRRMTGLTAAPVAVRVTRWEAALPQYEVGHGQRIEAIEADVARLPGLVLTGAAYRGIGVTACVRQATEAAQRLAESLSSRPGA